MTLHPIPLVTATVRPWSDRLWALIAKEHAGTISAPEQLELNKRFLNMETEQENFARFDGAAPQQENGK